MIDRENYEIWFLDYFDGLLSKESIYILFEFLKNNPDLRKEFEEFEIIPLNKEINTFKNKQGLKKRLPLEYISGLNEFEILAINKLENNISKEEENELKSFLRFSSEKKKEMEVFSKTKITPDLTIEYSGKKYLKRNPGIIFQPFIFYISSIAALLILIMFIRNIVVEKENYIDKNTEIVSQKNTVSTSYENHVFLETNTVYTKSSKIKIPPKDKLFQNKYIHIDNKPLKQKNNIVNNNILTKYNIEIKLPDNRSPVLLGLTPKLKEIEYKERGQISSKKFNNKNIKIETPALYPKEFLIKTVKNKLDINDGNYQTINPIKVVVASINKLDIVDVTYKDKKLPNKKRFALNIGRFGFERSWTSN